MTKNKNNVIQFPDIKSKNISDSIMLEINRQEEAADMATFCMDMIQKGIRKQEHSELSTIDFNDIKAPEHKDGFVILNLLASMFLRKGGVKHLLHQDLDAMFCKLVVIDYSIKNDLSFEDMADWDTENDDWDDE